MDRRYLLRNSLSEDYNKKVENIQSKVKPLLSRTTNVNPTFTEHTLEHSLSVENLYDICFYEIIEYLNDDEKFLLIVATLIHDIGMVGNSRFIEDENYGEEVRSGHNYRSGDFIDEFKYDLGLDSKEADAIKRIASSHRVVPIESIDENEPYGQGGTIRVKLLSSLIRLADELDILEERAPYLVKKYLGISKESLIHHERHEVMTGINRIDNCINIKAVAYNSKLETAIMDMYNEILKKHSQVKDILKENNIFVDDIKINIDVTNVIKSEVLLFIAEKDESTREEIFSYLEHKRSQKDIDAVLSELKSRKYIEYNEGKFLLNRDKKFFKLFTELFIRNEDELKFTKSIYVKNFLTNNFMTYVREKFGVVFDEGDMDDRIQILTHFPTSLEYLLDDRNTPYEPGCADRRITLDLGLLHAVSIDALKYPEEFDDDVFNAALSIEKSLGENAVSFFKIIQGIAEVKKNPKEQLNSLFSNQEKSNGSGSFVINSKINEGQLPNTDFFTLLAASGLTGIPIELSRNVELKNINLPDCIGKDMERIGQLQFSSLKIFPNQQYIEMEISRLFKFELNSRRRELDIYILSEEIEHIDDYPFELFIKHHSTGTITFKVNCHMAKKISDVIKFDKMMDLWAEQGLRRLRINNSSNNTTVTIVPDKINVNRINYVEILETIIKNAELSIYEMPFINSDKLTNKIIESEPYISGKEYCNTLISDIRREICREQTNILILLKDEEGKIKYSARVGVLPCFVNLDFINFKPSNKDGKECWKKILKREVPIMIEKYIFDISPEDYFKELVSIFKQNKNPFMTALSKLFNANVTKPTGKCSINIGNVEENYWNKQQNISFIVKYANEEINNQMKLENLLLADNHIDAIPLMQLKEDEYLESLAYAYYLKKEYDLSLYYCEKAIGKDVCSVCHFTKGLVYLTEGRFDEAYTSYMNGMYLNKSEIWYPVIKDNIEHGIEKMEIINNDNINRLINKIEIIRRRNHSNLIKKCFCGSKRHYYDCCGKDYKF